MAISDLTKSPFNPTALNLLGPAFWPWYYENEHVILFDFNIIIYRKTIRVSYFYSFFVHLFGEPSTYFKGVIK